MASSVRRSGVGLDDRFGDRPVATPRTRASDFFDAAHAEAAGRALSTDGPAPSPRAPLVRRENADQARPRTLLPPLRGISQADGQQARPCPENFDGAGSPGASLRAALRPPAVPGGALLPALKPPGPRATEAEVAAEDAEWKLGDWDDVLHGSRRHSMVEWGDVAASGSGVPPPPLNGPWESSSACSPGGEWGPLAGTQSAPTWAATHGPQLSHMRSMMENDSEERRAQLSRSLALLSEHKVRERAHEGMTAWTG